MNIKDTVFAYLCAKACELDEVAAHILYDSLTGAQKDTLIAAAEKGPLLAGDVPSKSGRDDLLEMGFLVQVVVKGEEGFAAATPLGSRVCKYGRNRGELTASAQNSEGMTLSQGAKAAIGIHMAEVKSREHITWR